MVGDVKACSSVGIGLHGLINLVFRSANGDTSLNTAYYKTLRTRVNDRDCAETRGARSNTRFLRELDGDLKGAWNSGGYRRGIRARVMK